MNNILKKLQLNFSWDQLIADFFSKPFIFLNIHPNIITFIGVLLGILSAFFYSFGNIIFAKIGSIIFFLAACFDHVDGLVARKLNKTSIFGHYFDHIGVCISYIALFIGLGIWTQKNTGQGFYYGVITSICIFFIMSIRFYLERKKGPDAIYQRNILGFEQEDILYLIIPVTFLNKIETFLYYAYIGTPIFLIITIVFFFYKIKKL